MFPNVALVQGHGVTFPLWSSMRNVVQGLEHNKGGALDPSCGMFMSERSDSCLLLNMHANLLQMKLRVLP